MSTQTIHRVESEPRMPAPVSRWLLARFLGRAWKSLSLAMKDPRHPDRVATQALRTRRRVALEEARLAVRLGFFDEAARMLQAEWPPDDAQCMNLKGVLHEARSEWACARDCYRYAVQLDSGCAAARQNNRRMYELLTFGKTTLPMALGDERPALAALLRAASRSCLRSPYDLEKLP